jgi:pimeloyl-ACP methyl ester carboxylesterase
MGAKGTSKAAEPWKQLTKPAPTLEPLKSGHVKSKGAEIYYAVYGSGPPLILLHGGLGNTEHWGNQIPVFSTKYRVITIASRGHGRSTRDDRRYSYNLMASDVLTVMDELSIAKASIVGWSDGGNIGLDIAINNPNRLVKLFVFGANYSTSGLKRAVGAGATFGTYKKIAAADYARLSTTPKDFKSLVAAVSKMWSTEPKFTESQLKSIHVPVAVAAGEYDEIIKRSHTESMHKLIPGSSLIIMPRVSHFAMWQDPEAFNKSVLDFLSTN